MNCVCGHPASDHNPSCDCGCGSFEYDDGTDGARPLYWGQPERWTL